MAILRILNGPYAEHIKELSGRPVLFGRHEGCDLVLGNQMVSRQHARMFCSKGRYCIEDLGSRNGTIVNGKRISEAVPLSSRDWIEIGDVIFQFADETAIAPPDADAPSATWAPTDETDRSGIYERPTAIDPENEQITAGQASPRVKLQALMQITSDLGTCLDAAQIQQRIVDSALRVYPHADGAYILQCDETTGRLLPVATQNRQSRGDSTITLGRIPQSIVKRVIETRTTIVSDPGDRSTINMDAQWYMCAPLLGSSGTLLGAIYLESRDGREIHSREDRDLLTCIAALAAQSIEQIQNHGRRYRAVVNTSAQAILTFDEKGTIESANPASERVFGYDVGRLIGQNITAHIPQLGLGDRQQPTGLREDLSPGPMRTPQETLGCRADGTQFPMEISLAEFRLDGSSHFTVICQDITERKRAEKELRDSQERISRIVQTGIVGIAFGDSNGRIFEVNERFCLLTGYSRAELLGPDVTWKNLTSPEYAHVDRQALAELRHKGVYGPFEKEYIRKDGRRIPVSVSAALLPDKEDEHVVFVVDNSRRKKAEQKLRSLNAKLEKTVVERTRNVRMLQDVAVIANEAESVQEALQSAVETICRHAGWLGGRAFLMLPHEETEFFTQVDQWFWQSPARPKSARHPDGLVRRVLDSGEPSHLSGSAGIAEVLGLSDAASPEAQLAIAFPILLRGNVCGVLEFLASEPTVPSEELLQTMTHVCTQLGRVVERRQLQQKLIDAVWNQHRNFGQELHDSLGQELSGIRMMAETLQSKLSGRSYPESGAAAELTRFIQDAQEHARQLAKGLFPVDIFDEGLMAALEELSDITSARSDRLDCVFLYDRSIQVCGNELATHLFRIAQEAVNNAVKHSGAERIEISIRQERQRLTLEVADDGTGIAENDTTARSGMGLEIMRYRASAIGGNLTIGRNQPRGTKVRCTVELNPDKNELAETPKDSPAHCG